MPKLRSSKLRILKESPVKSMLNLTTQEHFTEEILKKEYDKIISKISTKDIKNCLKSSSSEAQFYRDICNEELKKLKEEKEELEKQIRVETEINKKKDSEAARLIKRLWEDANKTSRSRSKVLAEPKMRCLKPVDVKKVWQEAKKLSNKAKQKRRKLLTEKHQLEAKIQLAKQAVQFCNKFGRAPVPKK